MVSRGDGGGSAVDEMVSRGDGGGSAGRSREERVVCSPSGPVQFLGLLGLAHSHRTCPPVVQRPPVGRVELHHLRRCKRQTEIIITQLHACHDISLIEPRGYAGARVELAVVMRRPRS